MFISRHLPHLTPSLSRAEVHSLSTCCLQLCSAGPQDQEQAHKEHQPALQAEGGDGSPARAEQAAAGEDRPLGSEAIFAWPRQTEAWWLAICCACTAITVASQAGQCCQLSLQPARRTLLRAPPVQVAVAERDSKLAALGKAVMSNMDLEELQGKLATQTVQLRVAEARCSELEEQLVSCS